MNIYYISVIAISLAMDAFGVTIGIGLNKYFSKEKIYSCIFSFAFFQFLFMYLGASLGYLFDRYIVAIPKIIGGIVILIIGIAMIIDGIKDSDNSIVNKKSTSIVLGISVSIDALVIGFSNFHTQGISLILLINSIYVGLITLLLCLFAYYICKFIHKISYIVKYSDFIGGITLIFFGLKILFL